VNRKLGDPEKAYERYEESLRIRKHLERTEGSDQSRRDLAIGHGRMGVVLAQLDEPDDALKHDEENLRIRELLLAESPESSRRLRDLWVASYVIAGRLLSFEPARADLAREHADRCVELIDELYPSDVRNERYLRERALTYEIRGRVFEATGDVDQARTAYEEYRLGVEALLDGNAGNSQYRRMAAAAHEHLGRLEASGGQSDTARRSYQQALDIYAELAEANDADAFLEEAQSRIEDALADLDTP
jgi:tetratricopeptide (TPR) repeat protein